MQLHCTFLLSDGKWCKVSCSRLKKLMVCFSIGTMEKQIINFSSRYIWQNEVSTSSLMNSIVIAAHLQLELATQVGAVVDESTCPQTSMLARASRRFCQSGSCVAQWQTPGKADTVELYTKNEKQCSPQDYLIRYGVTCIASFTSPSHQHPWEISIPHGSSTVFFCLKRRNCSLMLPLSLVNKGA